MSAPPLRRPDDDPLICFVVHQSSHPRQGVVVAFQLPAVWFLARTNR